MKTKLIILCAAPVILAAVVIAVLSNMASPEEKETIHTLTSHPWVGLYIEMPGLFRSVDEVFGGELRLTFEENGKCTLMIGDEVIRAKWKLRGDELSMKGKGIDTEANFGAGFPPTLAVYDIQNYMVIFEPAP